MKRMIGFACALVLAPSLATAQPKTPEEWYKEGENQYNLGNFEAAVKAFKEGFALEPIEGKKAAYLYNIAQSYRQAKDCSNAQFFYKRFLALKENDTAKPLSPQLKKDVEDRIRELEECARQQEKIKNAPPDSGVKPDGPDPVDPNKNPDPNKDPNKQVGVVEPPETDPEDEDSVEEKVTGPSLGSARVVLGGTKMAVGGRDVPIQAAFGLMGGYPLALNDQALLEVGVGLRFARVGWETMGISGDASLTSVMANGAVTYEVAPKMAVRGDLGLGMLFLAGASGSPFTNGKPTDGTLALLHARLGASFDYTVTPNIVATVPLALAVSPAKSGMDGGILAFDFMVGIGYRM